MNEVWEYERDVSGSWQGQFGELAVFCENGNERSVSIQRGKFIDELKSNHLQKRNPVPYEELVN